jgi:dipeptide/tripeptide permease
MTVIAPGDAFLAWGWRVPFLLSVVLILIGYYVRRCVEESPVFTELAERKEVTKTPIVQLFRKHALLVLVGVFTLLPLVNTGDVGMLFLGLAILTIGLGFTYGPQAALYSELFPASVRFSGVSISYAIGAVLGGAFAPSIAAALVAATGSTTAVAYYLAGMTLLGLIATLLLRDRSGIPLRPDHEAEQSVSPIYGMAKA